MNFLIETEFPIAWTSRDHTHPHGTANDNTRWKPFNEKLYQLMSGRGPIRIMDLGCAGGGFVKDCVDDGHIAIGLEGSDFSLLSSRAEWKTIPENLFTCDVTKPFRVYYKGEPASFDIITGWELLEHLPEDSLEQFLQNCIYHLSPQGLMIFSVSKNPEFWHVCVHDEGWWDNVFSKAGLRNRPELVAYFGADFVRGPHRGDAPNSFHVVLEKKYKMEETNCSESIYSKGCTRYAT